MAGRSTSTGLLNQFAILASIGATGDLSDADLLGRFLVGPESTSRAATTALVERHGPMVLRACRHVLADPHDAQDAFQATFLVLARKAGSVQAVDSVGGWLHGIALRVSKRAKADAARRRAIERQMATMKITGSEVRSSGPDCWLELHEEIARLPARYREPVILCYLEGMSTEAAANRIGCPRGTVLSRLSRARDRLRRRLTVRGLAPMVALMTPGSSTMVGMCLPNSLLAATARASLDFAAGRATELATASSLARGMLRIMTASKMKALGMAITFTLGLVVAQTFGQLGGTVGKPVGKATDEPRVHSDPAPIGKEAPTRVLYLAGPDFSWEPRYLAHAMDASRDFRTDLGVIRTAEAPTEILDGRYDV